MKNNLEFYQSRPDFLPLFTYWHDLPPSEKNQLLHQMEAIDLALLEKQKIALDQEPWKEATYQPFTRFSYSGNKDHQLFGKEAIKAGKVGCLVLAGGQGTRLRFEGPKGLFPISPIKNKSLFQLIAERVRAAGQQVNQKLHLSIMTSPQNDQATRDFFEKFNYFGLDSDQVSFFSQKTLPFLNQDKNLFLENPHLIAKGPNGNGFCFQNFLESGIATEWFKKGIKYLNVITIDNPLADPFDSELVGFHINKGVDVTLKCTEKKDPEEQVGLLIQQDHHCRVVEYSELSEEEKLARLIDGQLKHRCANLSLFCFSMDFVRGLGHQLDLPLHPTWKSVKIIDAKGLTTLSPQPNAWKFEAFIFDVLKQTQNIAALLYPREECFAPLKNFAGQNSPDVVKKAIEKLNFKIAYAMTGIEPLSEKIELDSQFYYPTEELLKNWKGKQIGKGYINL